MPMRSNFIKTEKYISSYEIFMNCMLYVLGKIHRQNSIFRSIVRVEGNVLGIWYSKYILHICIHVMKYNLSPILHMYMKIHVIDALSLSVDFQSEETIFHTRKWKKLKRFLSTLFHVMHPKMDDIMYQIFESAKLHGW